MQHTHDHQALPVVNLVRKTIDFEVCQIDGDWQHAVDHITLGYARAHNMIHMPKVVSDFIMAEFFSEFGMTMPEYADQQRSRFQK